MASDAQCAIRRYDRVAEAWALRPRWILLGSPRLRHVIELGLQAQRASDGIVVSLDRLLDAIRDNRMAA